MDPLIFHHLHDLENGTLQEPHLEPPPYDSVTSTIFRPPYRHHTPPQAVLEEPPPYESLQSVLVGVPRGTDLRVWGELEIEDDYEEEQEQSESCIRYGHDYSVWMGVILLLTVTSIYIRDEPPGSQGRDLSLLLLLFAAFKAVLQNSPFRTLRRYLHERYDHELAATIDDTLGVALVIVFCAIAYDFL